MSHKLLQHYTPSDRNIAKLGSIVTEKQVCDYIPVEKWQMAEDTKLYLHFYFTLTSIFLFPWSRFWCSQILCKIPTLCCCSEGSMRQKCSQPFSCSIPAVYRLSSKTLEWFMSKDSYTQPYSTESPLLRKDCLTLHLLTLNAILP